MSLTIIWYALHGHSPTDVAEHRARAPWYRTKTNPSTADMLAKLRRTIIAAQYSPGRLRDPYRQKNQRHPTSLGRSPALNGESRGNRRWSYMARWNTQTVPTLRHPDSRELRKCSEFLDSGEWANPGLEPGTSSLSGKPFVPSSPPNSNLIPANPRDRASGRRLEATGRYNLMAP